MAEAHLAPLTLESVRHALALTDFDAAEAHFRMSPRPRPTRRPELSGTAKLAAVMVLLYPVDGVLTFALMRRPEYEGVHSGQISLPGGKHEDGETFEQTAIRETAEEIGVTEPIDIIGTLTPIYVPPSDFEIHPFVGALPTRPTMHADPIEVAEIIEVPLSILLDEGIKGTENWTRYERPFTVHFYRVGEHKVWGATAIMLSELEARLLKVLTPD